MDKAEKERQTEQAHGHQGETGWDELDTGTDAYTGLILCTEWMTNENPLYSSGNSPPCSLAT